LTITTMFW